MEFEALELFNAEIELESVKLKAQISAGNREVNDIEISIL